MLYVICHIGRASWFDLVIVQILIIQRDNSQTIAALGKKLKTHYYLKSNFGNFEYIYKKQSMIVPNVFQNIYELNVIMVRKILKSAYPSLIILGNC
jgi:hypothetical protein